MIDKIFKAVYWVIYPIKVVGWLAFSILALFDKLGADFQYRYAFAVTAFILFLNFVGELLNEILDRCWTTRFKPCHNYEDWHEIEK